MLFIKGEIVGEFREGRLFLDTSGQEAYFPDKNLERLFIGQGDFEGATIGSFVAPGVETHVQIDAEIPEIIQALKEYREIRYRE